MPDNRKQYHFGTRPTHEQIKEALHEARGIFPSPNKITATVSLKSIPLTRLEKLLDMAEEYDIEAQVTVTAFYPAGESLAMSPTNPIRQMSFEEIRRSHNGS